MAEPDNVNGRHGFREGSERSLGGRASRPGMSVRQTDADDFDLHGPGQSQPRVELRRIVVARDGIGGRERLEQLDHERIGVVARVEDAVGAPEGVLQRGGKPASEAREVCVADEHDPRAHVS